MNNKFSFGCMSRPLMIKCSESFTFFNLIFTEHIGLRIESDQQGEFGGLTLRTPKELARTAYFLACLADAGPPGPGRRGRVERLHLPGFSPEFKSESSKGYNATALYVRAWWWRANKAEISLYIQTRKPSWRNSDIQGIPASQLRPFAEALEEVAHAWNDGRLDLRKEEPLKMKEVKA